MTNTPTRSNQEETRGRQVAEAIVRWTVLAVLASFVALAVLGQTRPTAPKQEQAKPENAPPQRFHSTIALIIDAPAELKPEISAAMKQAFSEIRDTSVYIFQSQFKQPTNWTISVSANGSGEKNDQHFVMAVAYSRAEVLVDPGALMDALENKVEIPTAVITPLIRRGRRSVSNFKALWVTQGSMKDDLAGAATRAASLFDHDLLSKDRDAFARTPPIERSKQREMPKGIPFPH